MRIKIYLLILWSSLLVQKAFAQKAISVHIDPKIIHQKIDNIGTSSAWFAEFVGKHWSDTEKEKMAKWLFSKKTDAKGNPEGIGLSAFRFNIGGGTTELGDSSGIKDFRRRAESFLNADGTYDWSKQSGFLWFVKKAKDYGVKDLIAFSNTPPVHFTQNGLGYKTVKDYTSNLRPDKYQDFADFLTKVLQHFSNAGINFGYISPINEPQWDWYNNNQEGSPWTNPEIARMVKTLDSSLSVNRVQTKIITPEAGHLEYLYAKSGKAGRQIQSLFDQKNPNSIIKLNTVFNAAVGHSYYTDQGDSTRIAIREHLRDTAAFYGTNFWQTEYSMLGDGYKEGKKGKIPALDCALFLGKVIHDDFVYANATAWQFWNSCEPGSPDFDTRYYLLALQSDDKEFESGVVNETKMLWALGNYSRFIEPGMHRFNVTLNDGLSKQQRAQNVMVSAFGNAKKTTLVCINYTEQSQLIYPVLNGISKKPKHNTYVTDATRNLTLVAQKDLSKIDLPARSITTIVIEN